MEKKTLVVFHSSTIRGIVKKVNEDNIKKEDILSLMKEEDEFILLYYN